MLDWLGGLIGSFGGALGKVFSTFGEGIVDSIWNGLVEWMMKSFYGTISDVFTQIGGMGAEIFDLSWIVASVRLFACLGWTLFAVGMIVAAFDLAIEYQNGRANVKSTALNVLKGFFAANLVTLVPVELYKFCINLQNIFLKDLAGSFVGTVDFNLGDAALKVLIGKFGGPTGVVLNGLFPLAMLIGLSYCVLKVFFSNIKRGGILLIQMAVGTLYDFLVRRGYNNLNALLSFPDVPPKGFPYLKRSQLGGIRALQGNQQGVVKAVTMEPGHYPQVLLIVVAVKQFCDPLLQPVGDLLEAVRGFL